MQPEGTGNPSHPCDPEPWAKMATAKDEEGGVDECGAVVFELSGSTTWRDWPAAGALTGGGVRAAAGSRNRPGDQENKNLETPRNGYG